MAGQYKEVSVLRIIGLIGGMSWESSSEYYRRVNMEVKRRLGSPHSCHCVLYSVEFARMQTLQHAGRWDTLAETMIDAAHSLERAGAQCIVICSNTMHQLVPDLEQAISLPILHIGDAAAQFLQGIDAETVGLLGTRFTMERPFLRQRLESHGLRVKVPSEQQRHMVHRVIYEELVDGRFLEDSRRQFQAVIADLATAGCQAVILGCTEIPLLIKAEDSCLPIVDTTGVHARAAVDWALSE